MIIVAHVWLDELISIQHVSILHESYTNNVYVSVYVKLNRGCLLDMDSLSFIFKFIFCTSILIACISFYTFRLIAKNDLGMVRGGGVGVPPIPHPAGKN